MLSVLLLILKIIGIILLVILGLALLILFVPIFYKGDVHYSDDGFFTHMSAHWMIFPVRFKISYEDGELKKVLRIFGVNIFREKKDKNEKIKYEPPVAEISYENELELQARYGEENETLIDFVDDNQDFSEKELLDPKFTSVEYPDIDVPNMEDIDTGIKDSRWTKIKKRFKRKKKKPEVIKKKTPLSKKIKSASIRTRSKTLGALAKSIKAVEGAMKKLRVLFEKISEYINFINRKSTRRAFKKMKYIVIRVVKHVFPKRIRGKIDFGFEEPHLTGQALGGIAMAYDMFGIDPEEVEVFPHFDKEMIDARLGYRGRIFIVFLLYYAIKFFVDPDIRKTMKFLNK